MSEMRRNGMDDYRSDGRTGAAAKMVAEEKSSARIIGGARGSEPSPKKKERWTIAKSNRHAMNQRRPPVRFAFWGCWGRSGSVKQIQGHPALEPVPSAPRDQSSKSCRLS